MFFHLIILNIFFFFIATELLLVIVNSCLERHLPHGLLFVIAISTSILHVCLNVIAMIFSGVAALKQCKQVLTNTFLQTNNFWGYFVQIQTD
jgi:hypothetical protein